MTMQTREPTVFDSAGDTNNCSDAHLLAQALFKLRLILKALAAVTDEDDAIAHPSGISINLTAFDDDALTKVCEFGSALLRTSLNQVIECFRNVPVRGEPREIFSVLRAIRTNLERVAAQFKSRPFTNDRRMVASMICAETCGLCALAIHCFAVNNFRQIKS